MNEYRIVCDAKYTNKASGETKILESTQCLFYNHEIGTVYHTKQDAIAKLKVICELCKDYDKKQSDYKCSSFRIRQSNIRIQEREVSDWKDSKSS